MAIFTADMERHDRARQQQHGGQLHRQHVRTEQADADRFRVDHRAVDALIVGGHDGVDHHHQQQQRDRARPDPQ